MEDEETKEWLSCNMQAVDLEQPNNDKGGWGKFAIITIHDVTPYFFDKIHRAADALSQLGISFNLAVIPWFMQKQEYDLRNNIEWLKSVLQYRQPVTLHGLYHEDESGKIEDFHNFDFNRALKDIREGLQVFSDAGLRTSTFMPPAWTVNVNTINAILQLGLSAAEADEEVLLLKNKLRLQGGVLNWDQGSVERNTLFLKRNRQRFREKLMKGSQMVRLAIHPKDPEKALGDQEEMIQTLKDESYDFVTYEELMTRFSELIKHN
jgi:predicted deacetylase